MARAIIHNSNYASVDECKNAIDRYFLERNQNYKENPKKAGNKIWGKELVEPVFQESNNCKDPKWHKNCNLLIFCYNILKYRIDWRI